MAHSNNSPFNEYCNDCELYRFTKSLQFTRFKCASRGRVLSPVASLSYLISHTCSGFLGTIGKPSWGKFLTHSEGRTQLMTVCKVPSKYLIYIVLSTHDTDLQHPRVKKTKILCSTEDMAYDTQLWSKKHWSTLPHSQADSPFLTQRCLSISWLPSMDIFLLHNSVNSFFCSWKGQVTE